MSDKIFHAYDIRGLYETQITIETAAKLGLLLADEFKPKTVVIGYDQRIGSEKLANATADAFLDSGVNVLFIGLVPTPLVYFGVNHHNADMGIMVTASHNPKEYVGFKVTREKAIPIGLEDGLDIIESRMDEPIVPTAEKKGTLTEISVFNDYLKFILPYAANVTNQRVLIDCSNGATGSIIVPILENLEIDANLVNITPDGTFPVHPPNPLDAKATDWLGETVRDTACDCGIMFDGDGDRIGVVDENGHFVPPDVIGLLISQEFAERSQDPTKETILYDLRSTKSLKESLDAKGMKSQKTKVGHTFIKKQMRESGAIFGSELSGHYYYQDFFNCDDAMMAMFDFLTVLGKNERPLSELVRDVVKYAKSPEINIKVADRDEAIAKIKTTFADAELDELDGITITYPTWWANIRSSNTEPLLRFNIEADTKELLDEKVAQLRALF